MSVFAIELDDRAVSLARDGTVLTTAPSTVVDGSEGAIAGTSGWSELRSRPMATSSRHLGATLTQRNQSTRIESLVTAELRARLAEQPKASDERVWIAVPARAEAKGLVAMLGIVRNLALPIDGFIDSAVVTAAALGLERNAVILELGLHHAAATAVDCEGAQIRRRRAVITERGGILELYQAWLEMVSKTMVKRSRFDPLHDAATEQQLFDAIPSLALAAAATGSSTASVTKGQVSFDVALTRDQFVQAAAPIYRSIVALLHQFRPAGAPVVIVVPGKVAELPGLRDEFEQFVGCELVSVPDGFAAAATSLLDLPQPSIEQDSVRLLRRLPLPTAQLPSPTLNSVTREALGQRRASGPAPSHVLLDGRAYSLSGDSLVVGRAPFHITLPDGLAGVSRRHCTFVHDGDELVLLDHSSFGTHVNGERVQERVRVYAGDRVRLGEPGVELALIAVGEATSNTQQP
jgi:hypothetical protein